MKKKIIAFFSCITIFCLLFSAPVFALDGYTSSFTVSMKNSSGSSVSGSVNITMPFMSSVDDEKGAIMSLLWSLHNSSGYDDAAKNSAVLNIISNNYAVICAAIAPTWLVCGVVTGFNLSTGTISVSGVNTDGSVSASSISFSNIGYSDSQLTSSGSNPVVYSSQSFSSIASQNTKYVYKTTYLGGDTTLSGSWLGMTYNEATLDGYSWLSEENKSALSAYFFGDVPGPDEDPEAIEPQVKFIWDESVFTAMDNLGSSAPLTTQGYYEITGNTSAFAAFRFMLQTGLYTSDTYTIEVSQLYDGEVNVVGSYILNNVMTIEKNKVYTVRVPIQETWTIKQDWLTGQSGYLICRVYSNRTLNESSGVWLQNKLSSSADRLSVGENTGGSTIDDVIGNEDNTVESTDKTFLQKIEDFFTKYVVDPFNYIAEKIIGIFKAITGIGSSFSSFIGNFLSFLPADYLSILKAGLLLSIGLMIFKLIRG